MYAWFPDKAKVNRRERGNCAVVRATAAKTMQAQGEECGYFHAPLRRRHACRVVKLDRCHGVSAGHSNQRAVSQCNPVDVSQRSVVCATQTASTAEPWPLNQMTLVVLLFALVSIWIVLITHRLQPAERPEIRK